MARGIAVAVGGGGHPFAPFKTTHFMMPPALYPFSLPLTMQEITVCAESESLPLIESRC